jgi:hypothetical protein
MLWTNLLHVCEHDRLSLLTSGNANAILNSLAVLMNGAALLPFRIQKEGANRLAGWLAEEAISICPISAPLFRSLVFTLTGKEAFPDLRVLRLTSESVYETDVDLYQKYFPASCLLSIALNSSETGLLRACFIDHQSEVTGANAPLGYPVQDKDIRHRSNSG